MYNVNMWIGIVAAPTRKNRIRQVCSQETENYDCCTFCTSSTLSEAPYANLSSHVIFYYTRRYGQSKPLVIRSKRNVYQYPEAAAFAIDLGFRMESDPELQKEFCDYISSVSTNHSLSIFEFYRHIGVEISSTFYTDVANSVNRWLSSLTYAWRKQ